MVGVWRRSNVIKVSIANSQAALKGAIVVSYHIPSEPNAGTHDTLETETTISPKRAVMAIDAVPKSANGLCRSLQSNRRRVKRIYVDTLLHSYTMLDFRRFKENNVRCQTSSV